MINQLRNLENFSLSLCYANKLSELYHNESFPNLGPIASSFFGTAIIFPTLGDTAVQGITGTVKVLTGLITTPHNYFCSSENAWDTTLLLSTAMMHLLMAIDNLFNAILLPCLSLYHPDKTSEWIETRMQAYHQFFGREQEGMIIDLAVDNQHIEEQPLQQMDQEVLNNNDETEGAGFFSVANMQRQIEESIRYWELAADNILRGQIQV